MQSPQDFEENEVAERSLDAYMCNVTKHAHWEPIDNQLTTISCVDLHTLLQWLFFCCGSHNFLTVLAAVSIALLLWEHVTCEPCTDIQNATAACFSTKLPYSSRESINRYIPSLPPWWSPEQHSPSVMFPPPQVLACNWHIVSGHIRSWPDGPVTDCLLAIIHPHWHFNDKSGRPSAITW